MHIFWVEHAGQRAGAVLGDLCQEVVLVQIAVANAGYP
jgi:hypothetical protein